MIRGEATTGNQRVRVALCRVARQACQVVTEATKAFGRIAETESLGGFRNLVQVLSCIAKIGFVTEPLENDASSAARRPRLRNLVLQSVQVINDGLP